MSPGEIKNAAEEIAADNCTRATYQTAVADIADALRKAYAGGYSVGLKNGQQIAATGSNSFPESLERVDWLGVILMMEGRLPKKLLLPPKDTST